MGVISAPFESFNGTPRNTHSPLLKKRGYSPQGSGTELFASPARGTRETVFARCPPPSTRPVAKINKRRPGNGATEDAASLGATVRREQVRSGTKRPQQLATTKSDNKNTKDERQQNTGRRTATTTRYHTNTRASRRAHKLRSRVKCGAL